MKYIKFDKIENKNYTNVKCNYIVFCAIFHMSRYMEKIGINKIIY